MYSDSSFRKYLTNALPAKKETEILRRFRFPFVTLLLYANLIGQTAHVLPLRVVQYATLFLAFSTATLSARSICSGRLPPEVPGPPFSEHRVCSVRVFVTTRALYVFSSPHVLCTCLRQCVVSCTGSRICSAHLGDSWKFSFPPKANKVISFPFF